MRLKVYHPRFYKYLYFKIIRSSTNANITALSVSIGVFLGFFLPAGIQLFFLSLIILILKIFKVKINILLASIATLVSNPITDLPLYSSYIIIGKFFYDTQETIDLLTLLSNFWDSFSEIVKYYFSLVDLTPIVYEALVQSFFHSTILFIKYFFIASTIFAIIGSILSFLITKYLILKSKQKK